MKKKNTRKKKYEKENVKRRKNDVLNERKRDPENFIDQTWEKKKRNYIKEKNKRKFGEKGENKREKKYRMKENGIHKILWDTNFRKIIKGKMR